MKNFKLTIFALLISVTAGFAQNINRQMADKDISDRWVVSDFEKTLVVTDDNETYLVKQLEITEEFTPVILDTRDKYKLNQDIIWLPTEVSKKIRLDYDKDIFYDKEVKFNYIKSDNANLDFTLTKKGIKVKTDNKVKINNIIDKTAYKHSIIKNRIQKEGKYTLELSNGEKIDITVTDYNIMK